MEVVGRAQIHGFHIGVSGRGLVGAVGGFTVESGREFRRPLGVPAGEGKVDLAGYRLHLPSEYPGKMPATHDAEFQAHPKPDLVGPAGNAFRLLIMVRCQRRGLGPASPRQPSGEYPR